MDRKTLAIIAACLVLIVFWWPIMDRIGLGRYNPAHQRAARPDTTAGAVTPETSAADTSRIGPRPGGPGTMSGAPVTTPSLASFEPAAERTATIETPLYRATFSSRGARLLSVELLRYPSAHGVSNLAATGKIPKRGEPAPEGDRVTLDGGPTFGLDLGSGASRTSLANVDYAVAESTDASGQVRVIAFTAQDSSGMHIRQVWRVRPDSYALDLTVDIQRVPEALRVSDYSLVTRSWPLVTERDPQSDERMLRACSLVGSKVYRDHAGGLLKRVQNHDGNVAWAGVQSHYFLAVAGVMQGTSRSAIATAEQVPLRQDVLKRLPAGTRPVQEVAVNSLVMALPGESSPAHRFVLWFGPSDYRALQKLGQAQLDRAADMGWGWLLPINHLLLLVLDWLYAVVRNYGLAIILLATLVRVALHPLNMTSMKSMRAMQKLQPEVERLREKYKDDAAALNTAIMAVYKENKVNPAGGCLPMLLQMPVLFSLFQVLSSSIQLRLSPFMGWMNDLSSPDVLFMVGTFPIHVLPLIMTGTGVLLQRLTPTNPQQAPSAYLMNAMMLFFFYNMPSGLVLYWTVMNLLSALQQWMVLRQDDGTPVVVRTGEAAGPRRKKAARG
jgi:YidC/Oxa1 family membrane protein insertase